MVENSFMKSVYDSINNRNIDQFLGLFADDGQFNDMATGRVFRGKSEIRGMIERWMGAFPDMKLQLKECVGQGDLLASEILLLGTHQGAFEGPMGMIPASGKKVSVPSCDVYHLRGGKIQSLSCYAAIPVLLSQIGALAMRKAA